jgi:hypothetical protein
MPGLRSLFLIAALVIAAAPAAEAAKRALVVGIDRYDNVPALLKAVNDADAVAGTLERLGFAVEVSHNPRRRELNRVVLDFSSNLEAGDTALFFFAGHGVRIDGRNYLLPSDIPEARPGDEEFVAAESITADAVLDQLRSHGAKIALLILDACRDNPFETEGTRSLGGTRGLARMAAPEGSFIMYSAGVGQTALDRLGDDDPDPNSVFTRSLLPLLEEPGLTVTELARRVRQDVQKLAATVSHEQRPAYYDEITDEFALAGTAPAEPAPAPTPVEGAGTPSAGGKAVELAYWNSIRDGDNPAAFRSYLEKFPDGDFAALATIRLGELVAATSPEVAPPPANETEAPSGANFAVELAYWNSISSSREPDAFRSYLNKYPSGEFADLARVKLKELARAAATPAPTTPEPPTPEPAVADPSFDCAQASLPSERAVCGSARLAALDREIAELYRARRGAVAPILSSRIRDFQRKWLELRNRCGWDESCLAQQYLRQIEFLRNFRG